MRCEGSLRAFVAVDISDTARRRLARLQGEWTASPMHLKFVAPVNIHLTLAFLGDIESARVGDVRAAMDTAAAGGAVSRCEIAGTGFFGSPRAPRVIWAGLRGDLAGLAQVHHALTTGLGNRGFPVENRPLTPHLTLARIKSRRGVEGLPSLLADSRDKAFGELDVDRLQLYRSELGPGGPTYTLLYEAALGVSRA
jgi:2'-5' RNA ligase